jgi:RNA polymerase sigma-70 factor (ECF subfamily)
MRGGSDTQLQDLLLLVRSGNPRAKALLLDHACDRLLRLTRKMFHSYPSLRRWEATDDVFNAALLRLSRSLDSVPVESVRHFFNLASRQIRRELLDLKKRYFGPEGLATNHHTDHQAPDQAGGTLYNRADEPEDLATWSSFHLRVDALPEEQREVVNLLFYEGLTQQEAAEVLGVGLRTIKRRWQEAKLQLHEDSDDGPD